jgi:DNA polymerase III delta subunit
MNLRIFDVNQVNIQSFQYFFIQYDDEVIVSDLINYIKNILIPHAPIINLDENNIDKDLNAYLEANLFGDRSLLVINQKNDKNILSFAEHLNTNTSENIFIIKVPKDKFTMKLPLNNYTTCINATFKIYELSQYINYLNLRDKLNLKKDEVQSLEIISSNNYLFLHNYLKIKSITPDYKDQINDQSIYNSFDLIAAIFSGSKTDFIKKINRFFETGNDPIQFNSLLFWFYKSVFRLKLNPNIDLKNLRLFGDMSVYCKKLSQKLHAKLIQKILQKIHTIDKISKGQDMQTNPVTEIKKIMILTHKLVHHE